VEAVVAVAGMIAAEEVIVIAVEAHSAAVRRSLAQSSTRR
jgi:hypothetical protein